MSKSESHNTLERLAKQVQQLRIAESMLIAGTTIAAVAVELECSTKQARRLVAVLESMGAIVSSSFKAGDTTPATFKMTSSSRLFMPANRRKVCKSITE